MFVSGILFFACSHSSNEVSSEATISQENEVSEDNLGDAIIGESEELEIASAHLLLSPALFKVKLENGGDYLLLDVRTAEELAENGFIEGAKNIDFYTADFKEQIEAMSKDVPVMLYCRSGGRSGQTAAMMKELGFSQVYDLNGGYNAWLEAGY